MGLSGKAAAYGFDGADEKGLMAFGKLAGETDEAVGSEAFLCIGEKFLDAMGRFVADEGVGKILVFLKKPLARASLGWEEADVEKAIGWETGGGKGGDGGEGSRDRDDGKVGGAASANEAVTRVAEGGGSGIGDKGKGSSSTELLDEFGGEGFLVFFPVGNHGLLDLETLEEADSNAGILAGDTIDGGKDIAGAKREVGEVSDRGGHQVKVAGLCLENGKGVR